jgi:hypothetical protein
MASTVTLKVWWQGPGRALPRFELDGKRISLAKLAKLYGLPEYAVMARISRGLHPSLWLLPADELSRVTKREARRAA